MAIRVTAGDVEQIFDTDLTTPQLDAFIASASALVDDQLTGQGLSSAILAEIEKYLAAHFASARDPRESEAAAGGTRTKYQVHVGPGLSSTDYGARAIALDSTGTLAGIAAQKGGFTFRVASR